jgi:general secretion pathway protein N
VTALRRTGLFLTALAVLLIAFAPLRLALDRAKLVQRGFAAAEVRGTVWAGRLGAASFRGVRLGDLAVRLQPAPLLLGRTQLVLEMLDRPGRAVLISGSGSAGLQDATLSVPIDLSQGPVPLRGELRLQNATVLFGESGCKTAEGRIVTDLLTRNAEFLQWQGPELSAEIACRGRALLIPFRGRRDGTDVSASMTVEADGRYRLETRVVTSDLALAGALALAGFQARPEGLTRVDQGRFG